MGRIWKRYQDLGEIGGYQRLYLFFVQSPRRILDAEARVADLIDPETSWWNSRLLHEVFNAERVKVISQISLSPHQSRDLLIWRGTTHGIFTLCSAYHMDKELQASCLGGCYENSNESSVWKAIWSIKTLVVVKMFMWRACNNLLPTRANLIRWGVSIDVHCPICEQANETIRHIL